MVDWTVQRNLKLWTAVFAEFDAESEARQIVESVKQAVTTALGVNVLALGLGGILVAAFTTAALDVTGVLTATVFAIAGWLIIPARRRKLIADFETKIEKLNEDLATLLSAKFEEQLTRYERQLLEVVAPYERFLETERTKLESGLEELRQAEREVTTLEQRVVDTFPEHAPSARVAPA